MSPSSTPTTHPSAGVPLGHGGGVSVGPFTPLVPSVAAAAVAVPGGHGGSGHLVTSGSSEHVADASDVEFKSLNAKLAVLNELAGRFNAQRDMQRLVELLVSSLRWIVPFDEMLVVSAAESTDRYQIRVVAGRRQYVPLQSRQTLPVLVGGLLARGLKGRSPMLVSHLSAEAVAVDPAAEHLGGMGSAILIPVQIADNPPELIVLLSRRAGGFGKNDLRLAVIMSNLSASVMTNLRLYERLERAYKDIQEELDMVAGIQRSLLPPGPPACLQGCDVAVHYATSERAGGDYYDFFPLPGGKLGVLIADVSGHGSPAAVVMAMTRVILHTLPTDPSRPGDVMLEVNRRLTANILSGQMVTAFYGVIDPAVRTITYACAGHNPPWVRRGDGSLDTLSARAGVPLAVLDDAEFSVESAPLSPGDTLLLYTDGLVEARNPVGDMFGEVRAKAVLSSVARTTPAAEVRDRLLAALNVHLLGGKLSDDLTLIVLRPGA